MITATRVCIPADQNGPPHSAHGGVSAGHMAAAVDRNRAAVRLHSPIPMGVVLEERPLDGHKVQFFDGDRLIATVTPLIEELGVRPFGRLDAMAVALAEDGWLSSDDGSHPFPSCFGCGDRRTTKGLGLRPGVVAEHDINATFWTPKLAGQVPSWLIWAAIDCPSGAPALAVIPTGGAAVVTGELSVSIHQPIDGGQQYQIISRLTGRKGNRLFTEAAIVDERGNNLATARATWFQLMTIQ